MGWEIACDRCGSPVLVWPGMPTFTCACGTVFEMMDTVPGLCRIHGGTPDAERPGRCVLDHGTYSYPAPCIMA